MKKLLLTAVICLSAVLCVYLLRLDIQFSQPWEQGNYQFRFRLGFRQPAELENKE
ncbi:MAG: hypothetical protein HFE95_01970 [Acutalibacter sp.]|nr:hypothetical protein [Acutalibacter sp.]